MKIVKRIILALLVLGLSLIIFLVVSENNPLKEDLLDSTLALFGKPLFAMVSEGPDRLLLQKWYDDFTSKVRKQEIPPERVEQVACMILNAENMDTTFSARDLTQILDQALVAVELPNPPPLDQKTARLSKPPVPATTVKALSKGEPPEASFKILNSRLSEIYQLNQDLKELRIAIQQNDPEFAHPKVIYEYKTGSGVHVRIDPEMRKRLDQLQNKEIEVRIKEIARNKRVLWQSVAAESANIVQNYVFTVKMYQEARHKADSIRQQIILRHDSAGNMLPLENSDLAVPDEIVPETP